MAKRLMYLNRRAPHGSVYAAESLEVVLIGAAFDQQVCMAFVDDGVFQLLEGKIRLRSELKISPAHSKRWATTT